MSRIRTDGALCIARLDRIILRSWAPPGVGPPEIAGFRVLKDIRIRPQGATITYERVRILQSLTSGCCVYWQYRRRKGWLKPWRITLVADDETGLTPKEVLSVVRHCRFYQLVVVELALDFTRRMNVTRLFVKRHGVFGKSRRRTDRGGPEQLRYGSRKSGKLVRCYWKEQVDAFRVELELHSQLLRECQIGQMHDLADIPYVILPAHLRFVRLCWVGLQHYLTRCAGDRGQEILMEAQRKARVSLRNATRYLKKKGVKNLHRFHRPMSINGEIEKALNRWSMTFGEYRK